MLTSVNYPTYNSVNINGAYYVIPSRERYVRHSVCASWPRLTLLALRQLVVLWLKIWPFPAVICFKIAFETTQHEEDTVDWKIPDGRRGFGLWKLCPRGTGHPQVH